MMSGGIRRFNDGRWPPNTDQTGFSGGVGGLQNLDAPPLAPYTSAAPLMDVILNPRAARKALSEVPGMAEDF
jgi:hypothetical protein